MVGLFHRLVGIEVFKSCLYNDRIHNIKQYHVHIDYPDVYRISVVIVSTYVNIPADYTISLSTLLHSLICSSIHFLPG